MVSKVLYSSRTEEWYTPHWLFERLNREFQFTLDPCATDDNHKCSLYFTKEQDGLKQSWEGHRVFCNPPYGKSIGRWVKKCSEEGDISVMLIHSRTDTRWFHDYIYQKPNVEVRFLKGRVKFGGCETNAPFPSMVVIFRNLLNDTTLFK